MTGHSEIDFSPLEVIKKSLTDAHRSAYRVYKGPVEFVTVDAATALEALRESGVKNPFRIVREIRFMDKMLDETRFSNDDEVVSTERHARPGAPLQDEPEEAPAAIVVDAGNMRPQQESFAAEAPVAAAPERGDDVEAAEATVVEEEDSLSAEDVAALLEGGPEAS